MLRIRIIEKKDSGETRGEREDQEMGNKLRLKLKSAWCSLLADLSLLEIIVLSDNSDDSKGVSINRPPIQGLLDWYGYDNVEEYLEDTFLGSTNEDTPDNDTTDKNINDKDIIDVFYSPKSKGKYVPVRKKASQNVIFKSPIPITRCVLGVANVQTWDDIVKKFGNMKPGNYADKGKTKTKV
ncbi:hypothetical protein Tco_1065274 [Tanacetum coccineum]